MKKQRSKTRVIPIIMRPSPNHSDRTCPVDMVVLHFTGMSSLQEVLQKLCDPASGVSAHFVVDIDGRVFRLVDDDRRAWHAGVSNWQGSRDVNSRSIGIEIMNNGFEPYTQQQINSVMAICAAVTDKYGILPQNIVGHSDVAPGRKIDPGHLFPWFRLSQYGIGLHPTPRLRDYFNSRGLRGDTRHIRDMLTRIGYGQDFAPSQQPTLREMIHAFQSRYEPEIFKNPERAGIPTRRTLAMLQAIARVHDEQAALRAKRIAPPKPNGPKP